MPKYVVVELEGFLGDGQHELVGLKHERFAAGHRYRSHELLHPGTVA